MIMTRRQICIEKCTVAGAGLALCLVDEPTTAILTMRDRQGLPVLGVPAWVADALMDDSIVPVAPSADALTNPGEYVITYKAPTAGAHQLAISVCGQPVGVWTIDARVRSRITRQDSISVSAH